MKIKQTYKYKLTTTYTKIIKIQWLMFLFKRKLTFTNDTDFERLGSWSMFYIEFIYMY